ncbi:hypothetical protein HK097_010143 [Rhizophlyctis rosea]|uniref:Uncharacterized protein n=1 Tax=Rhizophlyctis rosea TaxID=64517 RepID=A0AAD5X0N0_9FUNG|nr:hypothetical protein HK097_010143 [Rhizophlyctis rosea]
MPSFGYVRWLVRSLRFRFRSPTTYLRTCAEPVAGKEIDMESKDVLDAKPLPAVAVGDGEAEERAEEFEKVDEDWNLQEDWGGIEWTALRVPLKAADVTIPCHLVEGLDQLASFVALIGEGETKTGSEAGVSDASTVDDEIEAETAAAVVGRAEKGTQTEADGSVGVAVEELVDTESEARSAVGEEEEVGGIVVGEEEVGEEEEVEAETEASVVGTEGEEVETEVEVVVEEEVDGSETGADAVSAGEGEGKWVLRCGLKQWRHLVEWLPGWIVAGRGWLQTAATQPNQRPAQEIERVRRVLLELEERLEHAVRVLDAPGPQRVWKRDTSQRHARRGADEEEDGGSGDGGSEAGSDDSDKPKPLSHADLFIRYFDHLFPPPVVEHKPGEPFTVLFTPADSTRRMFGGEGARDCVVFGAFAGFIQRTFDQGMLPSAVLDTGLFLLAKLKEMADLDLVRGATFTINAACLVSAAALVLAEQMVEENPRELAEWVDLTNIPTRDLQLYVGDFRHSIGENILTTTSVNANAKSFERLLGKFMDENFKKIDVPVSVGGAPVREGVVGPKRRWHTQGMRLLRAKRRRYREERELSRKHVDPREDDENVPKLPLLPFFPPPNLEHVRPLPTQVEVYEKTNLLERYHTNEWAKTQPAPAAGQLSIGKPFIPVGYGLQFLSPLEVWALGDSPNDEVGASSDAAPAAL